MTAGPVRRSLGEGGYDALREIRSVVREMRAAHRRAGARVLVHWLNRLEAAVMVIARESRKHAARD